jgi:hypothetical protein
MTGTPGHFSLDHVRKYYKGRYDPSQRPEEMKLMIGHLIFSPLLMPYQ